MEKKITKKEVLNAVLEVVDVMTGKAEDINWENPNDMWDAISGYCHKTIEQLDAKAENAQKKAAEKRIAGDELKNAVKAVLTVEPMTAEEIMAKIEDYPEDLSKNKVVSRLTQLINEGYAKKEDKKFESNRRKVYSLVEE